MEKLLSVIDNLKLLEIDRQLILILTPSDIQLHPLGMFRKE